MLCSLEGNGQLPAFTQSLASPTYSNPALTGWHGGLGFYGQYRSQWPGIPATYTTYNLGVDGYAHRLKSGFGLNVNRNRAGNGVMVQNQAVFHWSPKITLAEKTFLSPVASLQYIQMGVNWAEYSYHSHSSTVPHYHSSSLPVRNSVNEVGLGLGVAFIHNGFLASANSSFLNEPDMSFFENTEERLPRLWQFQVLQRFDLSEQLSLTPSIHFATQGEFNHLTAGLNAQYSRFIVSAAYRVQDAAMIAIGYELKERFRLSYSYDITVSSLSTQTPGSHEVGLRALLFQGTAKRRFIENLPLM